MMNYEEAVRYIEDIPMFGPIVQGRNKSGNLNLEYILQKLGNPHLKGKAIHIAGTNGKGSTATFIANLLIAKGRKIGIFTSPHLLKINERIAVGVHSYDDDKFIINSISNDSFADCANIVKAAVDEAMQEGYMHLSYFEFLFAMAAVFFSGEDLDYSIYETGLGGRLDATNVLMPIVSVITSIGLDHTKYLGNTIKEIATEKAGIIKANTPVVFNTQDMEADEVIYEVAGSKACGTIDVGKMDYIINENTDKTIDFSMHCSYYKYNNLRLWVNGALYQVNNAMTAIAACNTILGQDNYLTYDEINTAFESFYWPGRMEQILPNVILDGAHNMDAIGRFVEGVGSGFFERDIRLFFAVAGDKDYEPMIEMLCNELSFKEVYVTSLNSSRGVSSSYIAGLFKMYISRLHKGKEIKVSCDDDIRNAFTMAYYDVKGTDDLLFCVGSLYLIGSIKQIAGEVLK